MQPAQSLVQDGPWRTLPLRSAQGLNVLLRAVLNRHTLVAWATEYREEVPIAGGLGLVASLT